MKSFGKLIIDPVNLTKKQRGQSTWKKVAIIELTCDIDKYYRWLVQRRYPLIRGVNSHTDWLNPPQRGPHITIINDRFSDDVIWEEFRERFNGVEIEFSYDPEFGFRNNGEYIYIKVDSPQSMNIRNILQLGDPYYGFHLTIGLVPTDSIVSHNHNNWVRDYMINY